MSIFKKFEFLSELYGWFRIVLSFLIIGGILGAIAYYYIKGILGICIGIFIGVAGLITGVIVATKAWKKGGTMYLLSRTMASPELDKEEKGKD